MALKNMRIGTSEKSKELGLPGRESHTFQSPDR
jgi:hypothetical protein